MKRRYLFGFLMVLVIGCTVYAEQLSKIGVVDFNSIYENFFKESSAWRVIDQIDETYSQYMAAKKNELDILEEKKMIAINTGSEREELQLEAEIYDLKEHLRNYHDFMSMKRQREIEKIRESDTLAAEIVKAISYIAENEGFSAIFRSDDPNLLWYSIEVDITEKVLERLRVNATTN